MAEDIEQKEEATEEVVVETTPEVEESESSSTEEIDWKALAEAEKERADAAEALIIKNKNIQKRTEKKEETPKSTLTEERVLELINATKVASEDPAEKALEEAKRKLKELEGKNSELARAAKKKSTTRSDSEQSRQDGEKTTTPKLPDNSPLKDYEYKGQRIYAKKLANGQTHYVRKDPQPGEKRSWVA